MQRYYSQQGERSGANQRQNSSKGLYPTNEQLEKCPTSYQLLQKMGNERQFKHAKLFTPQHRETTSQSSACDLCVDEHIHQELCKH